MNMYQNEEVAWRHVQDMQREAENRRLVASARRSVTRAIARRLFEPRAPALGAAQTGERRRELA